jgi:DNA recombination protein RmuC
LEYVYFLAGLAAGFLLAYLVGQAGRREREKALRDMYAASQDCFSRLSLEALEKNSRFFLSLAGETLKNQAELGDRSLAGRQQLIDAGLDAMSREVARLQALVVELEKDRENKFGQLAGELKRSVEETARLQETAAALKAALADSRIRGQWGERMAEDVLRLAGFIEGINYYKQQTLKESGTRPDYTFPLPQGLKVNMDVKFPLNNYLAYLEGEGGEKEASRTRFLRDVRFHIKAVTGKDYIDPAQGTVDYVLLFIPNEQVYAFIHQEDGSLLDFALKNRVILCSPLTLYAILAVIRQAVDNFNLEKTASRVLTLMGSFYKQWEEYVRVQERLGKRLEDARREYDHLTGTRRSQLEKPLRDIEDLRLAGNLALEERVLSGEAAAAPGLPAEAPGPVPAAGEKGGGP